MLLPPLLECHDHLTREWGPPWGRAPVHDAMRPLM